MLTVYDRQPMEVQARIAREPQGCELIQPHDPVLRRPEPREMPLVPSLERLVGITATKCSTVARSAVHARIRAGAADSLPT